MQLPPSFLSRQPLRRGLRARRQYATRWSMRAAALALNLLLGSAGVAAQTSPSTFQGWVVEVPNGDTVAVRDEARHTYLVHLQGVAAPRGLQAYGGRAQGALRDLVFRQVVSVDVRSLQGRVLQGQLRRQGRDINLELITQGHAWVDVPHAADLPPERLKVYQDAESQARLARIGLWREKDPIPPWDKPARRH